MGNHIVVVANLTGRALEQHKFTTAQLKPESDLVRNLLQNGGNTG